MVIASLVVSLLAFAQNDTAQANGYDSVWKSDWVTHCRSVYTGSGKNASVSAIVLQVGDSITHSMAYKAWAQSKAGATQADKDTIDWYNGAMGFPPAGDPPDATSVNGYYLAMKDIGNRGMTASGGITTGEFLSGMGNGGPDMPGASDLATGRTNVTNTGITGNLHIDSVAWAFSNAHVAVVMLGTNDIGGAVATPTFIANLESIVAKLETRGIVVVLSTIPPRNGSDVTAYNDAIRLSAKTLKLPLIDYYAEILVRRSGVTWLGTLIDAADGIHPTGAVAGSDPYTGGSNGGTGTNCLNDGYLLRCWLTVQKLKEVRTYVVDGVALPGGGPPPAGPAAPAGGSSSGGGDHKCGCNTIGLGAAPWAALLAAAAFVVFRRR